MLACPEEHERSLDRCLVATAGRFADAGEQTRTTLGVAQVGRRHRAAVHEGVAERDVPRLEGMELAVEVLAAALESCAVCRARQRCERLRRATDARRAPD